MFYFEFQKKKFISRCIKRCQQTSFHLLRFCCCYFIYIQSIIAVSACLPPFVFLIQFVHRCVVAVSACSLIVRFSRFVRPLASYVYMCIFICCRCCPLAVFRDPLTFFVRSLYSMDHCCPCNSNAICDVLGCFMFAHLLYPSVRPKTRPVSYQLFFEFLNHQSPCTCSLPNCL